MNTWSKDVLDPGPIVKKKINDTVVSKPPVVTVHVKEPSPAEADCWPKNDLAYR